MPTVPQTGKNLIDESREGARVRACLEPGTMVQCQNCGAVWSTTDICYSCRGTVIPNRALAAGQDRHWRRA